MLDMTLCIEKYIRRYPVDACAEREPCCGWMKVLALAVVFVQVAFGDDACMLAESIQLRVDRATEDLVCHDRNKQSLFPDMNLVRTGVWTERWPDATGVVQPLSVTGELWTAAIQKTLDQKNAVYIPGRKQPYYLDNPIVLKSGQRLIAAADAELRLCPNVNTCMIRNEQVVGSVDGRIPEDVGYDSNILIEGGIWTTLMTANREYNGNHRGHASRSKNVHGCHGVVLLNHVKNVIVRNVTIRRSRIYGVHISDASNFKVENIRFDHNGRDGVHVNGNSSFGIIRNIRVTTHDDFVALNAWEWMNVAPVYGDIHHILVEDVSGGKRSSANPLSPFPDGSAEIRLLPGTRTFKDGRKVFCNISDCVLRNLVNIRTVKAYDQPNLEVGRDKDFCDPIGTMKNIFFRKLHFERPGRFQIAANVDGFSISDVRCDFEIPDNYRLVEIGPMSATYKRGSDNPDKWTELFSPDKDITVKGFRLDNVRILQDGKHVDLKDPVQRLVRISDQKLNSDYPNTTPRGGTGKVKYLR